MKKQFQSKSVPRGTRTIWRYLGALFILFTFAIGNVWGSQTDLVSGVTLPDIPTGTIELASQTDFIADENGWIVFGTKNVVNNKTWWKGLSTDGSTGKSWTAPSGTTAPFFNGSSAAYFTLLDGTSGKKTHAIRFTGAEKAAFLLSFNSDTRKGCVSLFSYNGTTQTLVNTKSATKSIDEVLFSDLTSSTTYIAYVYGNSSSDNSTFYEIALKAPASGGDPTPSTPTTPALTYNAGAYIVGGTALDLSTLINTKQSNGAITYSVKTDGGTSATISGKNFSATAAGTCVITASQAADGDTYLATSAEFNVVVSEAAPVVTPDVVLIENNTLNTADFRTHNDNSTLQNESYTVGGKTFTKNFKFGGNLGSTPFVNQSWSNKFLIYDVKSNSTSIKVYLYNSDTSNDRNISYQIFKDGEAASDVVKTKVSKSTAYVLEIPAISAPNGARIAFGVDNAKLRVCQVEVYENGTTLPLAGQVGYQLSPNRIWSINKAESLGGMEMVMYSDIKLANSSYMVLRSNTGTEYFKFSAANDVQLKVTTTQAPKFYVLGSAAAGDPDKDVQYGGEAGTFNVNLPHKDGYWYIIPVVAATGTGNEVRISKIAFATLPAGKHVTYSAGEGSVKEGKSLPTHADAWEGDKITLASGENLERGGYDFSGWKANGTGDLLKAGDKYTMTNDDVQFVAQWTEHIAKYGVKFMDGATKLDSLSVTIGEAPVFADPTKALYSFAGWKDGEDNDVTLSDLATSVTVEDTKLVLYAQWNKVYAADGTVNFADDNNSGALADFLPAGYACGNLDGSKNSVWGKESEGDTYFGYKLRHSGAYVELRVVANKRVTFTFGNYAQAGTIKVGEAAAETCTLTDSKYVIDTDAEAVIRFTTTSDGTVTLKSIIIGEIPALSDDATLSDLTLKYGEEAAATISGFSASKYIYNVDVPYGTAKADLPIVGATATDATNALVSINQAKDREDWKTVIRVQAEDRINDHDKYYEVLFNVLPKLGVELIKVVVPAGTHNDTEATGYFGGTGDTKNEGNSLKIGGGCYAGVVLTTEKTFKAGDVINIHTSAVSTSGGSVIKIYADNSASTLLYNTETIGGDAAGNNFFVLPEAVNNVSSLYVVRTDDNKWNGSIDYIAVYRLMAPFIEEFKIGDAVGTIDGTNIAIEVPYAADLEHLTPAVKYWANGTAQISPAIGVTDFSDPVVFTVSSGYAEDATGAYAPVPYTVTVTKEAHYEAKIGETGYATLVAAVEAAQDGDVIVLQEDVTNGAGVMLTKTDAKEITIDFGGYTYTAVSPAVGSAGTQNQAFHLEKNNTVTLKNGTITSSGSEIKMLIQNYCDLTLENITLDGSGLEGSHRYVMSNNCGDVVIGDGTTITAKDGDVAFDVCATNYYPEGVTVTVKDGATISGIVEYDVWGTKPADNHAELAIEGGNFDVTWNVEAALAEDAKDNLNVSGGTFTAAVPADYCAEGYAPTSWTVGTETKYGVHLAGVIRGAASTNSDGVYYYTLDNDVTIFSSESDGRLKTSNHIATSSDVVACGGDNGGYNVNKGSFVLQFPVNVKEFTIYGANNTERTISKVYVNATASTEIKIKNVGRELTGTYTNTKDEKCQTLTAVFAGDNVISANDYVLINLSGSVNMYRILYTEAECTDPVITAVNNTIGTVGESATVSVEATALGATYQWYTCDENGDNAEIIGTATAASYTFTKGAGVEYFKVVVGNNCNTATVSAVAKAEVWAPTTTLVDVTENTTWDWTLVTSRADGSAIDDSDGNGPKLNTTNGMIIGNYILGNNFDKVEGNNGAYAIRKAANKYYQGASLHMHTTVSGYLSIWAANEGHSMTLNLVNDGRDMQIAQLTGSQVEYKVYVKAGDVVIYNIPASSTYPMRVSKMIFTVDETPDYTRTVSNNIGTLCVDHNVVAGGALGATFYQIASRNELYNDKIDFEEVLPNEELKAGEPYIFKSTTGKIELFYGATAVTEPEDVRGMYGWFDAAAPIDPTKSTMLDITEENKSDILYIAQNKLWNCEDLVTSDLEVVNNRAYIVMSEVPTYAAAHSNSNGAPRRRVTLGKDAEQVVTGVENLNASEQPVKLLINGQIFILRGEKMYDATGRLVK